MAPSRAWPEWFKRGAPPAVRCLLWFALTVGLGRAVWSLLFNLYLRQVGFREDFIGDLNFWMALASALVAPLAGLLSNRLGRRTMLLTGAALEMIALLASVWFVQRGAIVAAMALSGIAFPLWIIAFNPLLAENTAPDERVSLFSLFNVIWLGTAMAGSLLGGWLPGLAARLGLVPDAARGLAAAAESAAAYRLAATAGILLYLPALGSLLFLPVAAHAPGQAPVRPSLRPLPAGALGLLAVFTAVSVLVGLGYGFYFPFLNLYFREGLGASPALVGLIIGLGQAAGMVGQLFAPAMARRLGQVRAVALAQAAAMPFVLGLALAGRMEALWLGAAFYLGRYAVWNTGSSSFDAFMMEAVPDRLRTLLNSLAGIPSGVGFNLAWALGGALGGRLIVAHGYPIIFLVAGASTLLGVTLYYWRFRAARPAPA